MDDLKPCPFCGGEAEFHTDPGPTGECYGWVGCNQCDAMSPHCNIRSMQPEELHPIDAWNARVAAARIMALQAALRHIADANPGAQSPQSLAYDMALVARQAMKGSTDAE